MKDSMSRFAEEFMIDPAALDADNTPAAHNLKGFHSATITIDVGAGGITFTTSNKVEFKLTHAGDDLSYAAVADADVRIINPDGSIGSVGTGGIVYSLIAAHAAATKTRIAYIGNKSNLKLLADFGGTHASPTPMAASLRKGNADIST
jgi:hypothetical protein